MIQPNELRIGNWVKFIYTCMQVGHGTFEDCKKTNDTDAPFKYEPIPLTSEILEKCGFKLNDDRDLKTRHPEDNLKYSLEVSEYQYIGVTNDDSWFVGGHHSNPFYGHYLRYDFKYLHQLQNLYFALTNEELIYKP